jgi:hypothetical protein
MTKVMMRKEGCVVYVCNVLMYVMYQGRSGVIGLIGRRNLDGGGKEETRSTTGRHA